MQPLRYSINVTLDGCCDHRAISADASLHEHHAANIENADSMLLGRVTYEMMESVWRRDPASGASDSDPFVRAINDIRKYVVSSTRESVEWSSELVKGDLAAAVKKLKQAPGRGILLGGLKLPLELAELRLIEVYEFVVHPRLAGHGPWLFDGLSKYVDLDLVSRAEFGSGVVALQYKPHS